jgi:hypothetical protein
MHTCYRQLEKLMEACEKAGRTFKFMWDILIQACICRLTHVYITYIYITYIYITYIHTYIHAYMLQAETAASRSSWMLARKLDAHLNSCGLWVVRTQILKKKWDLASG